MNNFLLSGFCGVIFAVELIAAYFGWHFVKKTRVSGWIIGFVLTIVMYKIAVHMACKATVYLGVTNDPFVGNLLLVPIVISSATSLAKRVLEI